MRRSNFVHHNETPNHQPPLKMKPTHILVLAFLSFFFSGIPASATATPASAAEADFLITRGTSVAYGKTEAEAYAKAKKKVPSGAEEIRVEYNKSGSMYHCRIVWKKK